MNGLLTIFKKKDVTAICLKGLLGKGLDTLSHRGSKARAALSLNNRLQIVDSDDDTAQLVMGSCAQSDNAHSVASHNGNILFFDGKLLNQKELCQQIAYHPNDPLPDAEIVLLFLEQHGIEGLKALHGYWSLVYLDAEKKTLYGARDHYGNRPMYFCHIGNHFALASESRTLYSLFDDARCINRDTVIDYLLWGNIGRADQYFFNDIHAIEPSHFVKYEIGKQLLTVKKYHTLTYNISKEAHHAYEEKEYLHTLRCLLTHSVEKHLQVSDHPLAFGLSGGMDSSTLLCLAKKTAPDIKFAAYTVTNEYDGGETFWAEKVIRHTGAKWIKVLCTSDQLLEKSEIINRVHSAPMFNTSTIAQYRLMEEIKKQGHTIMIDGQGGDELFGGYPGYIPLFLKSLLKNNAWINGWNEWQKVGNSGMTKKEALTQLLKLWAKAHYYSPQKLAQKKRKDIVASLIPQAIDNYFAQTSPVPQIKIETLNDALYESYTLFLANILRWGEHSAASQGITCVMPFADNPALTEFVFSIPSVYKIHNGWSKYLQRKAMEGIVPDEICWRREKLGFYIPEQKWLNDIKDALFDAIQKMEDPEDCIHKKHILANGKRLFNSANPLYQQFIFRCFSYLQWRHALYA